MGCQFPEHHRAPSGSGGRVLVLVLIAVAALAARAAARAADAALATVLTVIAIAGVVLGAAAVVTAAVLITRRVRRRAAARARAVARYQVAAVLPAEAAQLGGIRAELPAPRISASTQPREHSPARPLASPAGRPRCTRNVRRWQ